MQGAVFLTQLKQSGFPARTLCMEGTEVKHTECTFGKWEMKLALLLYLYISLLLLFPTAMADKNGEPDALAQENEKLERQLAEVTDNVVKAKDTLDKLLNGTITMEDVPEQDTKQLAEIIALNFPSQYTWMTAWLLSRLFSLILSHCPKCLWYCLVLK